jgi:hypothetical protein
LESFVCGLPLFSCCFYNDLCLSLLTESTL